MVSGPRVGSWGRILGEGVWLGGREDCRYGFDIDEVDGRLVRGILVSGAKKDVECSEDGVLSSMAVV